MYSKIYKFLIYGINTIFQKYASRFFDKEWAALSKVLLDLQSTNQVEVYIVLNVEVVDNLSRQDPYSTK